jgi:hypothetical protein
MYIMYIIEKKTSIISFEQISIKYEFSNFIFL